MSSLECVCVWVEITEIAEIMMFLAFIVWITRSVNISPARFRVSHRLSASFWPFPCVFKTHFQSNVAEHTPWPQYWQWNDTLLLKLMASLSICWAQTRHVTLPKLSKLCLDRRNALKMHAFFCCMWMKYHPVGNKSILTYSFIISAKEGNTSLTTWGWILDPDWSDFIFYYGSCGSQFYMNSSSIFGIYLLCFLQTLVYYFALQMLIREIR